ncbi:hypothetical protein E1171_00360, partial [Cytophagales bacterium RKSG123]|nr:hypothetical protein [Xanthovirga aplysinae]
METSNNSFQKKKRGKKPSIRKRAYQQLRGFSPIIAFLACLGSFQTSFGQTGNVFGPGSGGQIIQRGSYNSFFGYRAGLQTVDADGNTFIGYYAGASEPGGNNFGGSWNTFTGYQAGHNIQAGNSNSFLGANAGFSNFWGSNNTIVGSEAGFQNESGNANVFIGYQAGYNETGSNKLYIDNSNTSSPLIYGDFAS